MQIVESKRYVCQYCTASDTDRESIESHELTCGCNPAVIEKLNASGIVGKVYKNRAGCYYQITGVTQSRYPLKGIQYAKIEDTYCIRDVVSTINTHYQPTGCTGCRIEEFIDFLKGFRDYLGGVIRTYSGEEQTEEVQRC